MNDGIDIALSAEFEKSVSFPLFRICSQVGLFSCRRQDVKILLDSSLVSNCA
jgi:hypothetical protein